MASTVTRRPGIGVWSAPHGPDRRRPDSTRTEQHLDGDQSTAPGPRPVTVKGIRYPSISGQVSTVALRYFAIRECPTNGGVALHQGRKPHSSTVNHMTEATEIETSSSARGTARLVASAEQAGWLSPMKSDDGHGLSAPRRVLDADEATAQTAYRCSAVIAIYPITT